MVRKYKARLVFIEPTAVFVSVHFVTAQWTSAIALECAEPIRSGNMDEAGLTKFLFANTGSVEILNSNWGRVRLAWTGI